MHWFLFHKTKKNLKKKSLKRHQLLVLPIKLQRFISIAINNTCTCLLKKKILTLKKEMKKKISKISSSSFGWCFRFFVVVAFLISLPKTKLKFSEKKFFFFNQSARDSCFQFFTQKSFTLLLFFIHFISMYMLVFGYLLT